MSSQPASVGFQFDYSQNTTGSAGNAVGPTTPTSDYSYNTYTFYFQNNTQATDTTEAIAISYDLSSLADPDQVTSGSIAGTVAPGDTQSASFFIGSSGDGDDQSAACYSLQNAAAPLLTVELNGTVYTVCFWFFTDGIATDYQQMQICNNDQSSLPISSTPVQTTSQMQCISQMAGLSITLDGGGNALSTNSIYIEVGNAS